MEQLNQRVTMQLKALNLDATYERDNEGKMTSLVSPGGGVGGGTPNKYLYFYDPMGRLNGMTDQLPVADGDADGARIPLHQHGIDRGDGGVWAGGGRRQR